MPRSAAFRTHVPGSFDVRDFDSTLNAMQGCRSAVYLVHSMAQGKGYEDVEQRSAVTFARAAAQAGLSRIVYLGGIQPQGKPSRHLRSRLRVGATLRAGTVSTIELQASMIIGAGSESWRMVARLGGALARDAPAELAGEQKPAESTSTT